MLRVAGGPPTPRGGIGCNADILARDSVGVLMRYAKQEKPRGKNARVTIITVRECAPLVSDVFTTCYRTFVQNHLDFGGLRDASQRRAIRFRAGSGYYSRTVI